MAIAAVAGFAVLDTSTKFVSASVPVLMALWVRYMFQAVATTALVLPMRGRSVLRTAHPKLQFLRSVLLMMSVTRSRKLCLDHVAAFGFACH